MPEGVQEARAAGAGPRDVRTSVPTSEATPPRRLARLAAVLAVLVVPAALLLPGTLRGERLVSVLPVSVEPLRSEHPAEALAADRGARWVTGDRLFPFLTDQLAVREELRAGRLPTWEPRLGLGLPLFAGTLSAPLYPPNWLAVAFPPEQVAGLQAIVSLALAGLGLGLLLARLGLSRGAVLAGVVALELGGFGLVNLPYFMKVDAAVWIPWSLWAIEGLLRGRRWSGLALALATTLSWIAGFVPIAVFGLCLSAAWALARWLALERQARAASEPPGPRPRTWVPLAACAAFLALGVLGSAAQVVPTFEASRESARTSGGELLPQSLPDAVLWGLFVPDLFGGPADTTPAGGSPIAWWLVDPDELAKAELSNPLEWNTFALATAVLLALVAVVATPRRAAFPALALLVVGGFVLGRAPASWLYALPGLDLGAPGRALSLAWVLWPWLAALGVQALVERRPRAFWTLLAAAFALSVASFVLWIGLEPARWPHDLERLLLERYGERYHQTLETIRSRLPPERSLAAAADLARHVSHTLGAALACCAAAVLCALGARGGPRALLALGSCVVVLLAAAPPLAAGDASLAGVALAAVAGSLLVALASVSGGGKGPPSWVPLVLCLVTEGFLAAVPYAHGPRAPGPLFPDSATVDAIAEAAGDGRVLRFDASPSGVEELQRLARPNLLAPYGVSDLTPYVVFTPRTLVELVAALDPRMLSRRHVSHLADPALLDHPLLDLLRVRAILSLRPLEHPRLEPVLEREDFHVYRREGALPPARVVREARLAQSDEAALAALASPDFPFDERTLIAPEQGALLAEAERTGASDEPVPPASWKPGAIESVERPSRDRLDVAVWGSSGGWLVMHEQYAPGWRARVNGVEVPLLRADHAMRAVRIPRGESRVETWYAPRSLSWGTLTSLAALAAAVALAVLRPFQARAREGAGAGARADRSATDR